MRLELTVVEPKNSKVKSMSASMEFDFKFID